MINRSILDAIQNISRFQSSLEIIQQNRLGIEQVVQNHYLTVVQPLISEVVKTNQLYHNTMEPLQAFVEVAEQQRRLMETVLQAVDFPCLTRNASLFPTSSAFALTLRTVWETIHST